MDLKKQKINFLFRDFLIPAFCLLFFAILAVSGCSSQKTADEKTQQPALQEFRVGIVPLPHYAHMWIAKKKGFIDEELAKEGFKLNWQPFSLGPMVSEAFAANRLDMGVMGDFPAFIGRAAGTDYIIASVASSGPKTLALVVEKNSAINKVTDLKGKKVATTRSAYGQKLLHLLLEKNGMTMNDIVFIHMTMDDLSTALIRGDVDAGVMWDPVITRLEDAGEIKIIADGTDIYEAYAVLMARGQFLNKNPKAADAMLRAFQRGDKYLKENPDECIKLLMEDLKIPESQLKKSIAKFDYNGKITDKFIADMKDTEEFMRKNSILKTSVDVNAFIRKE